MHVARDRFARTIHAVGAVATFVSLRELVERHLSGKGTRGLVAVTFDDAYASVIEDAWPVMQALAVPITLFVVTDAARTGAPFWWDRVDELCARTDPHRWRSFEDECGLPEAFRAGQPAAMGPLRPLRQWILATHRGRWPLALEEPLRRLEVESDYRPSQRPLRFDELDAVMWSPLVDVGVHTVSHAVLPLLPDDEIRREMRAGLDALRERYPRTFPVLAPPFGLYDPRTVSVAKEEGLTACLSLEATGLDDGARSSMIPRFCMSARHQPWKAVFYTLGWWGSGRLRSPGARRYPDLPSATT
jgi:peptidoglycan/xylan/chitin deacetylase (PgdA/CDA1 family)